MKILAPASKLNKLSITVNSNFKNVFLVALARNTKIASLFCSNFGSVAFSFFGHVTCPENFKRAGYKLS